MIADSELSHYLCVLSGMEVFLSVCNIMAGLNQVPIDSGALSQHFTRRALHDGANQRLLIPLHSLSVITAQMESSKDASLSRWEINILSGE